MLFNHSQWLIFVLHNFIHLFLFLLILYLFQLRMFFLQFLQFLILFFQFLLFFLIITINTLNLLHNFLLFSSLLHSLFLLWHLVHYSTWFIGYRTLKHVTILLALAVRVHELLLLRWIKTHFCTLLSVFNWRILEFTELLKRREWN